MSARRLLRATERFLDRLMPWLFAMWLLGHAAVDYRRAGALTALVFLGASWALYDYGKERGRDAERAKRAEPLGRLVPPRRHR